MSWLASLGLAAFHFVYWLVTTIKSLCAWQDPPCPLTAERKQKPSHLALLFVPPKVHTDLEATECLLAESVERAAAWCITAGINRLTVYDGQGILAQSSLDIRARLSKRFDTSQEDEEESDIEYPLTPPSSDDSESRPISPYSDDADHNLKVITIPIPSIPIKVQRKLQNLKAGVRHRRAERRESSSHLLTVHIISRQAGKPAISRVANDILKRRIRAGLCKDLASGYPDRDRAIESELNTMLEGPVGFPEPELMLIHHVSREHLDLPLELHGFPPWQLRLTEFHASSSHDQSSWKRTTYGAHSAGRTLQEEAFRRALDEFNAAQMRLGK